MSTEKPLAGSVLNDTDARGPNARSYAGPQSQQAASDRQNRGAAKPPAHDRKLARKILASKAALFFETAAPRLWLLVGIIGLFILVSFAGLWSALGPLAHKLVLALFGFGIVGALALLARLRWPDRAQALRRLERVSNIKHRPASSYEDQASSATGNPASQILWRTHRKRLAQTIDKLRVGAPVPRTDRQDPLALRALLLLGVIIATAIAGDSAADRLRAAFYFNDVQLSAQARLDAWVTPPAYTVKPPIMLSDGSRPAPLPTGKSVDEIKLPQNSELVVRLSGTDLAGFALEISSDAVTKPMRIDAQSMRRDAAAKRTAANRSAAAQNGTAGSGGTTGTNEAAGANDIATADPNTNDTNATDASFLPEDAGELRFVIKTSSTVRVLSGRNEIAQYRFSVIPDALPAISLLKLPVRSHRGQLKLQYKISDDYGITTAQAQFELLPEPPPNPAKAWARKPALRGARPKLSPPPVLTLTMPRDTRNRGNGQKGDKGAKGSKAKSTHELAKHPWSGRKVRMTLIATDHAGQQGKSETIEMRLPERWFRNPAARAIAEQRRHLMWDARNRRDVIFALGALSTDPKGFIKNKGAYLGLRSAYHRLRQPPTPEKLKSIAEQLWHVAIRIEDGNLTDAQRRLRDAQDKLSKLLEKNASPEEIAKAMKELRQALADYMKQLAQQAPRQQNNPNGTGKNQFITSKDFEKMLRDLENMARSGNRNAAQQMLSEMRDLLDRLQSGRRANNGSSKQQREMMKMMDEFGDLINKQQRLMDDTFRQQQQAQRGEGQPKSGQEQEQNQSQPGQQGGQSQRNGEQGRKNGSGGKGQAGRNGEGEGQGQRPGTRPGSRNGGSQLSNRQGQLREMLDRLGRQMQKFGLKRPGEFGKAGNSMDRSQRALGGNQLDEGLRRERQALEQLRKGAQSMAEQMLSRMARRYGQQRGQPQQRRLDPLGRPRDGTSEGTGTEFSSRVQIPDKFRTQRSREILEELRRRLGESKRPKIELDYIERLLKQF